MAGSSRPSALVTDGSYPNALAAVRALGREGFRVTVGERSGVAMPEVVSFWSVHCANRLRYPDPRSHPEAAVRVLSADIRAEAYDVVIPVGLDMTELFVEYRDVLTSKIMLPPLESFRVAADKRRTFEFASRSGIPTPKTLPLDRWRELGLPVVIKHIRSGAFVARTRASALDYIEQLGPDAAEYVAQEYIPGCNGFGYFGFFIDGEEKGHFGHERLVQLPKEGGPSVVARGARNSRVRKLGRVLLESLNWNGAGMVEFKQSSEDGEFYLMEVNPKLWGSLDLAIKSGYNFPVWIARAVMEGAVPRTQGTIDDLVYQRVVPSGLKTFLLYPEFRVPFLRNLISSRVRSDLQITDPLPTLAGLFSMVSHAVK